MFQNLFLEEISKNKFLLLTGNIEMKLKFKILSKNKWSRISFFSKVLQYFFMLIIRSVYLKLLFNS